MIGIHWGDVILLGWALVIVALLVVGTRAWLHRIKRSQRQD